MPGCLFVGEYCDAPLAFVRVGLEGESVMDACRLRRVTASLFLSFHGLTRVMAVAVLGFQAYFDVLVFPK